MLRRAKILLVGTSVATLLSAQAASSQIVNGQLQIGGVVAGQELDVVDPAEGVDLTTAATGNAVDAATEGHNLRLRSKQRAEGGVNAGSDLTVHGWSPETSVLSAAAGNSAQTAAAHGSLRARAAQVVGPEGSVESRAWVSAHPSSSGDTSVLSHALGNVQQHASEGDRARVVADQYNYGSHTTANAQATLAHVKGSAGLTAAAGANQLGLDAKSDSVRLRAKQVATGSTEATADAYVKNGYLIDTLGSAAANSITLNHQGAKAKLKAEQESVGYVRAESLITSPEFGAANANAYGVGNTIAAASLGEQLTLDTDQLNTGGVDAVASFDGGDGYDVGVSASAYGNAVSAVACSDCDGALDARNSQTNSGDVSATGRVSLGGNGRRVTGTAQAVGNSASYVVNKPKG